MMVHLHDGDLHVWRFILQTSYLLSSFLISFICHVFLNDCFKRLIGSIIICEILTGFKCLRNTISRENCHMVFKELEVSKLTDFSSSKAMKKMKRKRRSRYTIFVSLEALVLLVNKINIKLKDAW